MSEDGPTSHSNHPRNMTNKTNNAILNPYCFTILNSVLLLS